MPVLSIDGHPVVEAGSVTLPLGNSAARLSLASSVVTITVSGDVKKAALDVSGVDVFIHIPAQQFGQVHVLSTRFELGSDAYGINLLVTGMENEGEFAHVINYTFTRL